MAAAETEPSPTPTEDDDLFSTVEYQQIDVNSRIPPPRFTSIVTATHSAPSEAPTYIRRTRTSPAHYTQHQTPALLPGLPVDGTVLSQEVLDTPTELVALDSEPAGSCLDYFSSGHLREDLKKAIEKLREFPKEVVKSSKKEADPYSKVHDLPNCPALFVLMANLSHLYPGLISEEKNFLLPSYNFVTICDKGGLAQCISKQYEAVNVGMKEVRGWAVFPRGEVRVKGVKVEGKPEINFGTLEEMMSMIRAESETDSMPGPCIMLLVTTFSLKQQPGAERERLSKLYFAYSVYSAFRLLSKGGNLVLKISSTLQPASVELIYLLYRHFQSISVVKPFATSSFSPCKYLICQDFSGSNAELPCLKSLCMVLERLHKQGRDMEHIIDLSEVTKHQDFLTYVYEENRKCMSAQLVRVRELADYIEAEEKMPPNRQDIADRCWEEWGLVKRKEEEEKRLEFRPSSTVSSYSGGSYGPGTVPIRRETDLSRFAGILDRTKQEVKLAPMTRYQQAGVNMDDTLASYTDVRNDNREKMQKMLKNGSKSKKGGAANRPQTGDSEPALRKKPKSALKQGKVAPK